MERDDHDDTKATFTEPTAIDARSRQPRVTKPVWPAPPMPGPSWVDGFKPARKTPAAILAGDLPDAPPKADGTDAKPKRVRGRARKAVQS